MPFDYSSLITDRTDQDIETKSDKAYYDFVDLNRVTSALKDLDEKMREAGYLSRYIPLILNHVDGTKSDLWKEDDEELDDAVFVKYLQNVERVKVFFEFLKYPDIPSTIENMGIEDANNIEKVLQMVYETLQKTKLSFWGSGEIGCGEQ